MKITKIVGHFLVETPLLGVLSTSGYVTEDGEVYINIKGNSVSREQIKKNALSIIGFSVTNEKIAQIESLFDSAAELFGFGETVKEVVLEDLVVDKAEVEVVDKEDASEDLEVEKTPAPKRRGRRRKES